MNTALPTPLRALLPAAAALLALAAVAAPARAANDYPTLDRVVYVEACMAQHPGPRYEMLSKCSCTLDKIASEVSFGDFETMATATNANSIGGERGSELRDSEAMQNEIKRFRTLQSKAKQSCFINVESK
jgi:hypothetical protein